ncbi:hypothetical protein AAMO2058_001596400 [Amorphochlora amoebiformis]
MPDDAAGCAERRRGPARGSEGGGRNNGSNISSGKKNSREGGGGKARGGVGRRTRAGECFGMFSGSCDPWRSRHTVDRIRGLHVEGLHLPSGGGIPWGEDKVMFERLRFSRNRKNETDLVIISGNSNVTSYIYPKSPCQGISLIGKNEKKASKYICAQECLRDSRCAYYAYQIKGPSVGSCRTFSNCPQPSTQTPEDEEWEVYMAPERHRYSIKHHPSKGCRRAFRKFEKNLKIAPNQRRKHMSHLCWMESEDLKALKWLAENKEVLKWLMEATKAISTTPQDVSANGGRKQEQRYRMLGTNAKCPKADQVRVVTLSNPSASNTRVTRRKGVRFERSSQGCYNFCSTILNGGVDVSHFSYSASKAICRCYQNCTQQERAYGNTLYETVTL